MNYAVSASNSQFENQARMLATDLQLAYLEDFFDVHDWITQRRLFASSEHEGLFVIAESGLHFVPLWEKFSPLIVDFSLAGNISRLQKASLKTELIAKAIGLKKGKISRVLDANAGLGQDSIIMSSLGAKVCAFERSPFVFQLLKDGLGRAASFEDLNEAIINIDLNFGDAKDTLRENCRERFEVVYLDPMFPNKTKNALVKKEMRILSKLAGEDADATELFEQALLSGCKRVVIKRPKLAGHVSSRIPDLQFKGSSSRFDVYLSP